MNTIITIDTGTTNTRVTLWQDDQPLKVAKKSVGVRNTAISGSKKILQTAIHAAIGEVLAAAKVTETTNLIVVASGMITSNLGLVEIPHLKAPVSLADLAKGMRKVKVPEVFDQPIWFIPGIKNDDQNLTPETITEMDVVRGEEVEAFGVIQQLHLDQASLIILPGSHTKMIKTDDQGRLTGSITSMTGELLDLLTKESILADSVSEQFAESIDRDSLLLGAQSAMKNGLGRAAFAVRLLGMYTHYDRNQRANYLLGAVLANDLTALKQTRAFKLNADDPIIIIGKPGLRDALEILLAADPELSGDVQIKEISHLAGRGAIQIAKKRHVFEPMGGK